ncbi:hypothetical protein JKP88DRAFT_233132 [Tribonema minus]|uniref:Uncharacterized protein n=1 Tax=Tribonema minus TaxID=303371 RepID=A0A835ZCA9_9STRA|nr:hypothetical protein JKP88DRAFT_233132 [Tribonema minus]
MDHDLPMASRSGGITLSATTSAPVLPTSCRDRRALEPAVLLRAALLRKTSAPSPPLVDARQGHLGDVIGRPRQAHVAGHGPAGHRGTHAPPLQHLVPRQPLDGERQRCQLLRAHPGGAAGVAHEARRQESEPPKPGSAQPREEGRQVHHFRVAVLPGRQRGAEVLVVREGGGRLVPLALAVVGAAPPRPRPAPQVAAVGDDGVERVE